MLVQVLIVTVYILASGVKTESINASIVLSGNSPVKGILNLTQSAPGQPLYITGQISGLTPNTQHGFHFHALGDISAGCESLGAHWNPTNMTHGDRTDTVRHDGDEGNLLSDSNGIINVNLSDKVAQLSGTRSVVGRSGVIHADQDDLGRGGNAASLANGNSGARLACGIVGLNSLSPPTASGSTMSLSKILLCIALLKIKFTA